MKKKDQRDLDNGQTGGREKAELNREKFSRLGAKIVCVLAALLVWFYVSGEQSPTYEKTFYSIPVTFDGMASLERQGYTIISGNNATVDVTVSGKRSEVNQMKKDDISVVADLSPVHSPDFYDVKVDAVTTGSASASKISPATVEVYIDRSSQKMVPVVPALVSGGTTDLSIRIDPLVPSFSQIRITGPAEELEKISHAAADVSLDRLIDSSVEYTASLYLVDTSGNRYSNLYVKADKTEVKVTVPVYKYKTVPISVAYVGASAEDMGYGVELSRKTAEIRGNADVVDSVDSIKTEPIDIGRINGEIVLTCKLSVLPGIEIMDEEDSITVDLIPGEGSNVGVTTSNICFINQSASLRVSQESFAVTFEFSGNPTSVSRLTPETVYALADLSAYTKEGTYSVPLTVYYPNDIGMRLVGEYTISVTLVRAGRTVPQPSSSAGNPE